MAGVDVTASSIIVDQSWRMSCSQSMGKVSRFAICARIFFRLSFGKPAIRDCQQLQIYSSDMFKENHISHLERLSDEEVYR
jgi:hypothetical protein